MNEANRQIRRVLASWAANGWLVGMDEDKQRELARVAADAIDQPQTWGVGEAVPREVDYVRDDRQMRWVRDVGPRGGGGVWICYVPEDTLTELVGPVTEDTESVPWDEIDTPYECKGCGAAPGDPHAVDCDHRALQWEAPPTKGVCGAKHPVQFDLVCDHDPHAPDEHHVLHHFDSGKQRRWVERATSEDTGGRVPQCGAKHPNLEVTCDMIHHPLSTTTHGNSVQGIQWTGSETGLTVATETAAEPAETRVALTKDAVDGLVGLLHQSAVKFTRLHTAYKGSATKGVNTLAGECEQAAQLLQAVLNGEEDKG